MADPALQHTSSVDLHQPPALKAPQSSKIVEFVKEITIMLRYILPALAVFVLLTASLIPEDADARGRGGGGYRAGGGGYRGGAVAVRGARGGAVAVRGGRYGYRGGAYRGYGYRGYGVGAAAVGAAAVGAAAAGAYRGSCYDAYGNYICAGGYRPY
jgi:hypothetical protein